MITSPALMPACSAALPEITFLTRLPGTRLWRAASPLPSTVDSSPSHGRASWPVDRICSISGWTSLEVIAKPTGSRAEVAAT